ncbi:MAG TPA: DegT/DnrJ/EryC1/StrS family aminotransferase [Jatrophihabitans sp.]|jgi:dTDP-4-amino-4,6-dideoxygalactose transaminase
MMPIPFLDLRAMASEIRDDVDLAWQALLADCDFVRGAAVTRFEHDWSAFCGTEQAIGVANGTDALWLTLRALGVGAGDEVVIPTNTFVATAEAVVHAGARPVFADVDAATLLMTADTIAAAVTDRTRAVVVVHLFGQLPDMDAIMAYCRRADLALIEDAAQAHGATWQGRRAGSFGVAGCFSFYPGKNLGAFGDGGAIVTSDDLLADTLRTLTDHGRLPGTRNEHGLVGFNSRLDTLQAAVLTAKLPHLDDWNRRRRAFVAQYRELLDDSRARLVAELEGGAPAYHLAVARVPERDRVLAALAAENIGSGVHYPVPCHQIAPYRTYARGPLPVAESAAAQIVSLPLSPHMSADDVVAVCEVLRSVVDASERVGG